MTRTRSKNAPCRRGRGLGRPPGKRVSVSHEADPPHGPHSRRPARHSARIPSRALCQKADGKPAMAHAWEEPEQPPGTGEPVSTLRNTCRPWSRLAGPWNKGDKCLSTKRSRWKKAAICGMPPAGNSEKAELQRQKAAEHCTGHQRGRRQTAKELLRVTGMF